MWRSTEFRVSPGFLVTLGLSVLLGAVLVFQAAGHRVILAEERECLARFGAAYRDYMQRVRRYL